MPTEMAATKSLIGFCSGVSLPCAFSHDTASWAATKAPVMAAVRVPPSACSTSQSRWRVRSPSALRSNTVRSERPIRRWISCVRPLCLPRAASRSLRVWVLRGSMPYSAVTPAFAAAALVWGHLVFDRRGAQHAGVAEGDQHRAFGVARVAAGDGDRAQGVVAAVGRAFESHGVVANKEVGVQCAR